MGRNIQTRQAHRVGPAGLASGPSGCKQDQPSRMTLHKHSPQSLPKHLLISTKSLLRFSLESGDLGLRAAEAIIRGDPARPMTRHPIEIDRNLE